MATDRKTHAPEVSDIELQELYLSFAEPFNRGDMPAARKAFEIYWRASWGSEPFFPRHGWEHVS